MSETPSSQPTPLGIYDRPKSGGVTAIEIIAVILSALWLAGAAIFFLVLEPEAAATSAEPTATLRFVMTALAIFLPVAMIWVGATAARASRVMREESQRLHAAIEGIRQSYLNQLHSGDMSQGASVTRKLDEIAAAQRKTETALAMFSSSRDVQSSRAPAPAPGPATSDTDEQASLALGTPVEALAPPISNADYIRALNFPETTEDEAGFAALRRALKDRRAAQLVQASQDILTLLSQDGIYMDDLRPDLARPEIWRRFSAGERGRAVAAMGGVRDRSSLALSNARMKQDPIFRDAAHHFLRVFDRNFQTFEESATDSEIAALSETRTARAFMLLGRVAGTFD